MLSSSQSVQPIPAMPDSVADRVRLLNDLATGRVSRPPAATRIIIKIGLDDSVERVQECALWALAGRVSGPRFSGGVAGAQWSAERSVLASLKPDVAGKLSSPSHRIRHAALVALGSFEYDPANGGRVLRLSDEFVSLLVRMYRHEPHALVRSEIVKAIALDSRAKSGENTLIAALDDSEPAIVRIAANGIAEHAMAVQLPKLATLLKHPEADVRIAVASALSQFGPAAIAQLRPLQLALAGEQEPDVRGAMSTAIAMLQGVK